MNAVRGNIETVARIICEDSVRKTCGAEQELAAVVDRLWRRVAAQLEGGLIDETGERLIPYDFHRDLEVYTDWVRRHPHRNAFD